MSVSQKRTNFQSYPYPSHMMQAMHVLRFAPLASGTAMGGVAVRTALLRLASQSSQGSTHWLKQLTRAVEPTISHHRATIYMKGFSGIQQPLWDKVSG
jgi:hypothetical protein